LDILVNNAGRSQRAQWENTQIAVDREIFELNVLSIVSLSRLAVRYFLQTGYGQIVINSSVAGFFPVIMSGSYNGTKHALQVSTFKPYNFVERIILRKFLKEIGSNIILFAGLF